MPCVLVVEDNLTIRKVIQFKLNSIGLDVSLAENGEDAWLAIHENTFDLAIVDFVLPNMDGGELIRRIRSNPSSAEMPIILITAKFMEIDVAWYSRHYGLLGVLQKPFSPKKLSEMVMDALAIAA